MKKINSCVANKTFFQMLNVVFIYGFGAKTSLPLTQSALELSYNNIWLLIFRYIVGMQDQNAASSYSL